MNKPSSLVWMVFILLLIFPTPAGKFIIDLAGGIVLLITIIPLLLMGVGWFAWKRVKSKIETCKGCGTTFLNNQAICPICGTTIRDSNNNQDNIPASAVTIDIQSEDIN